MAQGGRGRLRLPRRLQYRGSLARRLILLTTFAVAMSVALVALAAYVTVRHQLQSSMDDSLHRRAYLLARYEPSEYTLSSLPPWVMGATETRFGYITSDGLVVTTKAPEEGSFEPGRPEVAVARGESDWSSRTVRSGGTTYRLAAAPTDTDGIAVVIAQSLEANDRTLDKLGLVMLIFGALGVLAATAAGWGVARNGLRPVRRLTEAAEEIARTEKLDPIEVEGNDEIARMATAFNAMLTALSASSARQRQLVADAGHELRTPLTSLRTNLDLLTQADREGGLSSEARAELLDDVRFQIEELTTLIGDLTELAREEAARISLEPVDLAEVVDRTVQRVRRRAPGLEYDVSTEAWWVIGDSAALERAVTNLLDNCAKWSPPLGTVTVRLVDGTLLVADQGHGIAEHDLPHVFDRFYRSAESRTLPGSGLGLAIVRQVADRHGGSVRAGNAADSDGGGAAFWFTVPGSRQEPDRENSGRSQGSLSRGSAGHDTLEV